MLFASECYIKFGFKLWPNEIRPEVIPPLHLFEIPKLIKSRVSSPELTMDQKYTFV